MRLPAPAKAVKKLIDAPRITNEGVSRKFRDPFGGYMKAVAPTLLVARHRRW